HTRSLRDWSSDVCSSDLRGEQVLHRQRRVQPQPVDARHRHPLGIEARDDQRSELAAALDQDHHILGRQLAPLALQVEIADPALEDRKSTRLNSSHVEISYAVFCLKKKKN